MRRSFFWSEAAEAEAEAEAGDEDWRLDVPITPVTFLEVFISGQTRKQYQHVAEVSVDSYMHTPSSEVNSRLCWSETCQRNRKSIIEALDPVELDVLAASILAMIVVCRGSRSATQSHSRDE